MDRREKQYEVGRNSMNVAYIICEYNPFHNGHLYHINETKRLLRPDAIVCVMSGNFTQRGEPAIADKWARAEMALRSGADLVIELHTAYSCASSEYFALGAINAISDLNIHGTLSFGVETPEPSLFFEIADILAKESPQFKEALTINLKMGVSYAKARALATEFTFFKRNPDKRGYIDIAGFLKSPNNILAIEYLKAIKRLGVDMKTLMIKRKANSHNVRIMSGNISSATSIRQRIFDNIKNSEGKKPFETQASAPPSTSNEFPALAPAHILDRDIRRAMPDCSVKVLESDIMSGNGLKSSRDFFHPLLVTLRRMSTKDIERFPDVSEGLAERILAAAQTSASYEELLDNIASKRFPITRVMRILTFILLNIKKSDLFDARFPSGCPYIRVLGFSKKGRNLLAEAKKHSRVPIITNYSKIKNLKSPIAPKYLEIENRATDVYFALSKTPERSKGGQEFTRNAIIVK